MKIAVCVSGLCKVNHPFGDINKYNKRQKEKFPNADFYYATWRSNESEFIKHFPNDICTYFDEPIMHYHPYLGIDEKHYISQYFKDGINWVKKHNKIEWTSHHTKQILIHTWLSNMIKNNYDIIIRTRFDAFIHRNANFDEHINDTYINKRANCFATTQQNKFDTLYQSDIQKNPKMSFWMLDQLIIHPSSFINKQYVDQLHTECKLHPAEHGWYQTLGQPYNKHINWHGWVNHDKNILDKFIKEIN